MNAPVRVDAGTPLTIWRGLAVGGLDVEVATERPLPAPGYAGGALRGLLGRALARQVCPLPTPECGGCGLRVGCAYALAFKPATLPGAGAFSREVLTTLNEYYQRLKASSPRRRAATRPAPPGTCANAR